MTALIKGILLFLSLLCHLPAKGQKQDPERAVFRFHLLSEPSSFKPWEQKSSNSSYLLSQVTGTLLIFKDNQLKGHLAEKCSYLTPRKISCRLRKNLRWSSGKEIQASDFVRAFQEFLNPDHPSFRADLLFPIANARKVFSGELSKSHLKVSAKSTDTLEIELEQADREFIYTLTNPLFFPIPETPLPSVEEIRKNPASWVSSGPYVIDTWEAQRKIALKPNPGFWKKNNRPQLEVVFISEDSVALNLYEKGELGFLRRLPALFIPKYKGRPDFFEIEQIRFDYLGYGPQWKDNPDLRLALAQSLRYRDLQELYQSRGTPGCPGIPSALFEGKICLEFSLEKAKKSWESLKTKPSRFEVLYSKQGGDNHTRTMEWLQSEWKTHLNFLVDANGLENKLFTERLAKNPPDLFRKGIAPDRPTCRSALEIFETGHLENYIRFSNPRYDAILKEMQTSSQPGKLKKLCSEGLKILLNEAWVIPTGPIHFTLLAKEKWKGWSLNQLNHLDLSELELQAQ